MRGTRAPPSIVLADDGRCALSGKWFEGEHEAILDRRLFDRVQEVLKSKSNGRKVKRSGSGALLAGKLYDDKGNRMSPSFSTKNGVRYRFYVSSALLRGRKAAAGSVPRVAATEIEDAVRAAVETHQGKAPLEGTLETDRIERITIGSDRLQLRMAGTQDEAGRNIILQWLPKAKDTATVKGDGAPDLVRNESLIQSIVRAHAWLYSLREGAYDSIEQLAEANGLHPKVIRQNLRLAFLSPAVTAAILEGAQPAELSLARIPTLLPLSWKHHRFLLE